MGTLPEKLGFRPKPTGWLINVPERLTIAIGWPGTVPSGMCDLIHVTRIALDQDWSAPRFRYHGDVKKITRCTQSVAQ